MCITIIVVQNTVLWPSIMSTDERHEHNKTLIGIDGGAGQFVIAPGGRQIKILKVLALKRTVQPADLLTNRPCPYPQCSAQYVDFASTTCW